MFVPSLSWQIIVFQKETLVKKYISVVLPALVSAGVSRYSSHPPDSRSLLPLPYSLLLTGLTVAAVGSVLRTSRVTAPAKNRLFCECFPYV